MGSHNASCGKYVTAINVGSQAKTRNFNVVGSISATRTFITPAPKYRHGAVGGDNKPIPIFTPIMAAKWIGSTPNSWRMGTKIGEHSKIALVSSIIIPIINRIIFVPNNIMFLLSDKLRMASVIIPGKSSIIYMRLNIIIQNIITMITPVLAAVSISVS